MKTSVTSKHYTLVFVLIGSVIFIGRDSLLLSQDGGPGTSLRNPFKKPVFYLKFDSPNPKAPQDHACAEVNIRYCPPMLSICLLNFLSGGFGGTNTGHWTWW